MQLVLLYTPLGKFFGLYSFAAPGFGPIEQFFWLVLLSGISVGWLGAIAITKAVIKATPTDS